MARTTPIQPTAGTLVPQGTTDSWVNAIKELQAAGQLLSGFCPNASSAITVTYVQWFSLGSLVVPSWSTNARITWNFNSYQLASATATNTQGRMTVNGSIVGSLGPFRLLGTGTTNNQTAGLTEDFNVTAVAGSTVGLGLYTSFIGGTATAYNVTTTSFYSANVVYT